MNNTEIKSEMSKRPTPDTDAVAAYEGNWDTKALRMTAHARKLERERDEAREDRDMAQRYALDSDHAYDLMVKVVEKAESERDAARELARQMSESNQVLMADVRFYRNAWEQLHVGREMSASKVGFNGQVNIFTTASDLATQRLTIRFLRGKTEQLSRAQENPNHFFWNEETGNFYYIDNEKKLFRVEFIEEAAK